MNVLFRPPFHLLRPSDASSEEHASLLQILRLMCLVAAALLPLYGFLYRLRVPEAVDPLWARMGLSGLCLALFAASYVVQSVRSRPGACMQGLLYVLLGWLTLITALNRFADEYVAGLLFLYAVMIVLVGAGAHRMQAVWGFIGYGLLLASVGFAVGLPSAFSLAFVLVSMGTIATVEGIALQRHFATRRTLRRRKARLRAITDNISEGLFRLAPNRGFTYANQTFAALFGFDSPREVRQVDPSTLFAASDTYAEVWTTACANDTIDGMDIVGRRADGSTVPVRLRGTVVHTDEGEIRCLDGVVTDLSERRARKEELRVMKQKAEEANRIKSAFLTSMSHELRTPLTAIIGFAEAIRTEANAPPLPHFAQHIEESGHALMTTIDRVLTLSKLRSGELELTPEPVELTTEVEEIVDEFSPQAHTENIDLQAETDVQPVWVQADADGTQIVIENLLSNALKYTREGGHVTVRARKWAGHARVEVEDSGIGMNPDKVPALFHAFRQGSEGVDRKYQGAGLGLTLTKQVLDRMGGSIEVSTEEGEGTCSTVYLPK